MPLDVEQQSPVLDPGNCLALGQFPATSVWLGSADGVNALMRGGSVGLHDAPYAKVLSHLRIAASSDFSKVTKSGLLPIALPIDLEATLRANLKGMIPNDF